MFSTCLICHRSLGANEVIEMFPVGRRLAFDERTGRLWVVCKACGHWNLSPIEERWEAIEACERFYRDARIKAATDNIGLTRLKEGLDLIRIGKPPRPELSAWRYGPRIIARRKKSALLTVASAAAIGAGSIVVVGASISVSAFVLSTGLGVGLVKLGAEVLGEMFEKALDQREYERVVMSVSGADQARYVLRQKHMRLISFEADGGPTGWRLSLHHERGVADLQGIHATLAAGQLLARMNAKGASRAIVQRAAHEISEAGNAQQYIRNAIALRDKRRRGGKLLRDDSLDSFGLHYEERLAVEMAMHEDSERVALEGELAALEQAWKDAEEIGHISDRMFDK